MRRGAILVAGLALALVSAHPAASALVDARRFVSFVEPSRYRLSDLARDGGLAVFANARGIGVLDLRRNRVRIVASVENAERVRLSPCGHRLLVSTRLSLRVISLDGSSQRVIRTAPGTAWAIDGSGRQILFSSGCRSRRVDLVTGRELALPRDTVVPDDAWSPTAERFVLERAEYEADCRRHISYPRFATYLYRRAGDMQGTYEASSPLSWDRDGRSLLVRAETTGSAVAGLRGLDLISTATGRRRALLRTGFAGDRAFVGPGGWLVYARYDDGPGLATSGASQGAIWLARILTRG